MSQKTKQTGKSKGREERAEKGGVCDTYLSVLFVWCISRSLETRLRLRGWTLPLPPPSLSTGCCKHPHRAQGGS